MGRVSGEGSEAWHSASGARNHRGAIRVMDTARVTIALSANPGARHPGQEKEYIMDLHLEGKVVFVTGGFKGIGKGIALQLAREGAVPVVLNRKDGVEDEFRAEISEITKTFEMYYIDLNDTDAIAPIVEEVYKKYGHIDGVVNNAGRNDNLELETLEWRDFEKSLHGNLTHYFELVHCCCPYLKESKGSIVNIASKVALTGDRKSVV